MLDFARQLIEFRHHHPIFRQRKWFQGRAIHGAEVNDIVWFNPDGIEMANQQWESDFAKAVAIFLNGEAIATPGVRGERILDDSFLLFFNAHHEAIEFTILTGLQDWQWAVVINTCESHFVNAGRRYTQDKPISVEARSVVVLQRVG